LDAIAGVEQSYMQLNHPIGNKQQIAKKRGNRSKLYLLTQILTLQPDPLDPIPLTSYKDHIINPTPIHPPYLMILFFEQKYSIALEETK